MRRTREPMAENALLGSLQRSPPSPVDCYRPPTAGQSHPPPICSTSTGTYLPVESRPAAATYALPGRNAGIDLDASDGLRCQREPVSRVGLRQEMDTQQNLSSWGQGSGSRSQKAVGNGRRALGDGAPRGPRRSRRPARRHGRRLPRLRARPRWWRWLARSAPSWSSRPRPWPSRRACEGSSGQRSQWRA